MADATLNLDHPVFTHFYDMVTAERKLSPPFQPTEQQKEEARLRYVLDQLYDDFLMVGLRLRNDETEKADILIKRVTDTTDQVEEKPFHYIDWLAKHYRWDDYHAHADEMHWGDCTATSWSCMRCFIEKYYLIDTSPGSKAEGSRLLNLYLRSKQKMEEQFKDLDDDTKTLLTDPQNANRLMKMIEAHRHPGIEDDGFVTVVLDKTPTPPKKE